MAIWVELQNELLAELEQMFPGRNPSSLDDHEWAQYLLSTAAQQGLTEDMWLAANRIASYNTDPSHGYLRDALTFNYAVSTISEHLRVSGVVEAANYDFFREGLVEALLPLQATRESGVVNRR